VTAFKKKSRGRWGVLLHSEDTAVSLQRVEDKSAKLSLEESLVGPFPELENSEKSVQQQKKGACP